MAIKLPNRLEQYQTYFLYTVVRNLVVLTIQKPQTRSLIYFMFSDKDTFITSVYS